MEIQVLTESELILNKSKHNVTYSNFSDPIDLSEFDLNIINIQDEHIWISDNDDFCLRCSKDLISIRSMIESSCNTNVIIALPFNYTMCCVEDKEENFLLKDDIEETINILNCIIPSFDRNFYGVFNYDQDYDLLYGKSKTVCGESIYSSDFSFVGALYDGKTWTRKGEKPTTIQAKHNCFLTTLDVLENGKKLDDYLYAVGLDRDTKIPTPDWINDLDYFDDKQQKSMIKENKEQITVLNQQIDTAKDKLAKNLYYKSVLYESGDNLVKVVFDILSEMLEYDLSSFEDKKKEDFLIKLQDITFVGEIKGIDTNIKSKNVSQVDTHLQDYQDKLNEENKHENLKALLIINPFRNKKLEDREVVHEQQIALAKRNNCLIILTQDLLRIFEMYKQGVLSKDKIVAILTKQVGLLDSNSL